MSSPYVIFIPAKSYSSRLPGKNLQRIGNRTLVEIAIDTAKHCKDCVEIIVSTNCEEVRSLATKCGVSVMDRPDRLADTELITHLYRDMLERLPENLNPDYVVGLQPDHPDRNTDIDAMVQRAEDDRYDDMVTVSLDGVRNGGIRVMSAKALSTGWISDRIGTVFDDCTNIHTIEDLERARGRIEN
jgi:CMP-N-acetylneuraminic acid synthetase